MSTAGSMSRTAGDDPPPPVGGVSAAVSEAVTRALAEDLRADGDLTAALLPEGATAHFALRARRPGVLAGRECATETFRQVSPTLELSWWATDGDVLEAGQTVMEVTGLLRPILTAESTALNFLGHLSGIATLTGALRRRGARPQSRRAGARYAQDHSGPPGTREGGRPRRGRGQPPLQPLRGRAREGQPSGRGDHHRGGRPRSGPVAGRVVQIECDTLDQVAEAAKAGADALLFDNMTPARVAEAVALARAEAVGPILTEVSGGVTLESIGDYAAAGPDRISVGALTHSATVLDLGLDLIWRHTEGS